MKTKQAPLLYKRPIKSKITRQICILRRYWEFFEPKHKNDFNRSEIDFNVWKRIHKPLKIQELKLLHDESSESQKPPSKPSDLTPCDKLIITLEYYREYRTMERIGMSYGCAKSSVCRSINWVEDTLSADGRFQLPGKRALQEDGVKTVAIDVMEHRIERPKKNKRSGILGRKSSIR